MNQIEKLQQYCNDMLLDVTFDEDLVLIGKECFNIVSDDDSLFDMEFEFIDRLLSEDSIGWIYEFGGRWYIQKEGQDVTMQELRYVGKAVEKIPTKSFLGIHSGYELMNGIGLYKDWIKKAKFLSIDTLGICERGTLAGALEFQSECKKNGIKSIIGMTVPINDNGQQFFIKLYVKNFQGWINLLKINTLLNVEGNSHIDFEFVVDNRDGLFLIADPKTMKFSQSAKFVDFYQLDPANFLNEDTDVDFVDNLEKFIRSELSPISIYDAYYLEKDDFLTREIMWTVGKVFDEKTDNQFFKSKDQYIKEIRSMFGETDASWIQLIKVAMANERELCDQCTFVYDTDTRHLPKYIMTQEESEQFSSNEELFLHRVREGFKVKKIKDVSKYIERLKIEIEVLRAGDVIDYFLSLYDIIRYAKSQKMLTGIGRGSAGGSLVAYLLGIIQIDPLEFDLLFERFLNAGRMGEYQDRPSYDIELEDGSLITLAEGALVRVKRNNKETVVFVHDLKEGDQYIKH